MHHILFIHSSVYYPHFINGEMLAHTSEIAH